LRCQPVICVRKKRKCQHKSLLFDRFIFHVYSGRYQDLQTIEIIHKWEWNETTGGEMTFECFWKSMGTWASTNKFSLSTTKQTSAFPSLSYFIISGTCRSALWIGPYSMCFRILFFFPYFIGLVFYISDRDLIVLVTLI
jgi:hypothetical protein